MQLRYTNNHYYISREGVLANPVMVMVNLSSQHPEDFLSYSTFSILRCNPLPNAPSIFTNRVNKREIVYQALYSCFRKSCFGQAMLFWFIGGFFADSSKMEPTQK